MTTILKAREEKSSNGGEAFQLAMTFFNGGTESVFMADFSSTDNRLGVQKHPVLAMTIGIDFAV